MGLINFIVDLIRKIAIFFLSVVVFVLVLIYNFAYPMLHDANNVNVMLWIIIVPLAIISCLMKLKRD